MFLKLQGYQKIFLLGFLFQFTLGLILFYFFREPKVYMSNFKARVQSFQKQEKVTLKQPQVQPYKSVYDETLSNLMAEEVKIMCMVMTHPANHENIARVVKSTWGQKCTKLMFMSSHTDPNLDVFVSPFAESRDALWNKTKLAFMHMYKNYINDYDWFMKADDDSYLIVENLRYLLAQYNPKTALLLGHRYAVQGLQEGYMAGGAYILSKKAVQKFAEKLIYNETNCKPNHGAEDWGMGECLSHSAIFVDCRDEQKGKRFFPLGAEEHMRPANDPEYWYTKNQYLLAAEENTRCCSDTSVQFHYIDPQTMLGYEYYVYHVHPFGLDDNSNEVVPKKIPLKEVIAASDIRSPSANFQNHTDYHDLEPSEMY